jgi:hypothetical protein
VGRHPAGVRVGRLRACARSYGWLLAAALLCFTSATTAVAVSDRGPEVGTNNPIASHPLSQLTATRERPLFTPSRRPPNPAPPVRVAVAAAPPPVLPPAPPPFVLVGTITGQAANIAIVKHDKTGEATSLKAGDVRDGWTVTAIERRAVRFSRDERTEEIALQKSPTDLVRLAAEPSRALGMLPAPIILAPAAEEATMPPQIHSFGTPLQIAPVQTTRVN